MAGAVALVFALAACFGPVRTPALRSEQWPGTGETLRVSTPITDLKVGDSALWVRQLATGLLDKDNAILAIDPGIGRVVAAFRLDGLGSRIALGEGSVWVGDGSGGLRVLRIDEKSQRMVAEITVGVNPTAVAVGRGVVWAIGYGSAYQIDPQTNRVVDRIAPVRQQWSSVTLSDDAIWLTSNAGAYVCRYDLHTHALVRMIPVAQGPSEVILGDGVVWVLHLSNPRPGMSPGLITRIDSHTNDLIDQRAIGREPLAVAVAGDGIWVASSLTSSTEGSVWRLDPRTLEMTRGPLRIGPIASALAVRGNTVWAASYSRDFAGYQAGPSWLHRLQP